MYGMRMARVNITVPDELIEQARLQGLNVSRITAQALHGELDRLRKIAALDEYLAALERTLGPIPVDEQSEAAEWADAVLATPATAPARSGTRRTA